MNTDSNAVSPALEARALLKKLQEEFAVFRDYSPLAIGIDRQLLARQPGLDRKVLRMALGMHTHSLRYLKSMEKATQRLDLEGQGVAEVTDEHRAHAAETLRERFRKEAERKKAQREAEVQEKLRTEKLGQLVEKFGKHR